MTPMTTRSIVLAGLTVLVLVTSAAVPAEAGAQPTWSVRLSTPQIASASLGLVVGSIDPPDPPPAGSHLSHGLLLQIEPGVAGGKLSIGYARGLFPYAGAGIKASLLRTWGRPLVTEPRQTYAGLEIEASFFVNLGLGVLWRVDGTAQAPRTMVTAGIGLGF
jgi:hypothetical protein